MFRTAVILVGMVLLFSGCAVKEFGNTLKYNIQGEYYLQEKNFAGGRQTFSEALQKDPDNPQVLYFYGRFLLAENEAKSALPYLEKAAAYNPGDSQYHFWLGLAYGENGMRAKERASYNAALRLNPRNVQALVYLGNNLLQAGELEKSLTTYQQALDMWPDSPQALYNRAVILRKLKREPEEKVAWRLYLDSYPAGSFARMATDRLNNLGDFSYRNYRLGARTVTLAEITFVPLSAEISPLSRPSLDLVGAAVSNMGKGDLNIIVYQQNNKALAKKRAVALRGYLERKFPLLKENKRIRISWFGVPEERTVLNKKLVVQESVQFFLADPAKEKSKKKQLPQKKAGRK